MKHELNKLSNPLVHEFNATLSDWGGIDGLGRRKQGLVWQFMEDDQRARRREDAEAYARALLEDD